MIKASGVVSTALANIGFVLLVMAISKMFIPSGANTIKMLKDNLTDFTPQARCTDVLKLLNNVETIGVKPIFALSLSFHSVNVHGFITLIRVKKEPPALN